MEELMNKTENLIKSLENSKEIKTLKEKNKLLKEQKDLLKNIKEYQVNPTEELRERIINNPFYREYKKCENDCNFLILGINQRLKEVTKKGKSCHENH